MAILPALDADAKRVLRASSFASDNAPMQISAGLARDLLAFLQGIAEVPRDADDELFVARVVELAEAEAGKFRSGVVPHLRDLAASLTAAVLAHAARAGEHPALRQPVEPG